VTAVDSGNSFRAGQLDNALLDKSFGHKKHSMLYYILKFFVSALIIVLVSEIAKRSSGFAALIASLPLTSLLAIIWLHIDGSESTQIAELSSQIFWLVLPSLVFFLVLPLLLQKGLGFWPSLALSATATTVCYFTLLRCYADSECSYNHGSYRHFYR